MENLNPDQARAVLDFFLPSIEAEHQVTRLLLRTVPADKLDFRPTPGGKTVGDLAWHLVLAEHYFLTAVCEGRLPEPPTKPDVSGVDAITAWDDEHYPRDSQRLAQLSGDELLRPVAFGGTAQPAVAFLRVGMGNISHYRGQLVSSLEMCGVDQASVDPIQAQARAAGSAARAAGELSDADLAAVAGGDWIPITNPDFGGVTITTSQGYLETPGGGQATLGSLFGNQNPAMAGFGALGAALGWGAGVGIQAIQLAAFMLGSFF